MFILLFLLPPVWPPFLKLLESKIPLLQLDERGRKGKPLRGGGGLRIYPIETGLYFFKNAQEMKCGQGEELIPPGPTDGTALLQLMA